MAKSKFYAVAEGRCPGIYTDWATTEKQVKGFAAAKFKSFPTKEEAEAWLESPVYQTREGRKDSRLKAGHDPVPKADADCIVVYTDGGSINNPGPGGYGIVIENGGQRKELSGGFRHTTNNRMEMTAAIVALQSLRNCKKRILLYSDSSYLVNGIAKGWARKWRSRGWRKANGEEVLNVDLWLQLLDLLEDMQVSFNWVKGHDGNEYNERCDRLAVASARQSDLPADAVYEKQGNGVKGNG